MRYWLRGYGRDALPPQSVRICAYLWEAHLDRKSVGEVRSVELGGRRPTDNTDRHRWLGCVGFPTESTESTEVGVRYWLRGYGRDAIPS